jgi:CIC family chloride channel protein
MNVKDLLETKFKTIHKDANLGELVKVITKSKRNVFPVVDDDGIFYGVVHLNDIRDVIFKPELYDEVQVSSLMHAPMTSTTLNDSMEQIVEKFQQTPHFKYRCAGWREIWLDLFPGPMSSPNTEKCSRSFQKIKFSEQIY